MNGKMFYKGNGGVKLKPINRNELLPEKRHNSPN